LDHFSYQNFHVFKIEDQCHVDFFFRNGIEDVNGSEGVKIHNTSTFTTIEGSLYHMTSIEISKISLLAPRLLLLSAPLLVALAETSW